MAQLAEAFALARANSPDFAETSIDMLVPSPSAATLTPEVCIHNTEHGIS
jgi:hypothetical protein